MKTWWWKKGEREKRWCKVDGRNKREMKKKVVNGEKRWRKIN